MAAVRKMRTKTILNPKTEVLVTQALINIGIHQLARAKAVLRYRQQEGRFPTDESQYATLVTVRGQTRKRDLDTINANFLRIPSKIQFVRPSAVSIYKAVAHFLKEFASKAIRGEAHKPHPFKYAQSLAFFINAQRVSVDRFLTHLQKNQTTTDIYEIVNVAPHASTLEARLRTMYQIALDVYATYSPDVAMAYTYVYSDQVGYSYHGSAQGGPKDYAAVYALPTVRFGAPGLFSSIFVRPGYRARRAAGKRGRSRRRL